MRKIIYFYCVIEGDLMILSAIAKIIRHLQPSTDMFLILPEHPRVKDDKMKRYYEYFNEIIKLPYEAIYPSYRHFPKCFFNAMRFKKALTCNINPQEGATLFLFDLFKFQDLILLQYFKKKKVETNVITAFAGEQFNTNKLKLLFSPTLILTSHSFLLGLKTIFKAYLRRNTKLKGYHIVKTRVNNILTIEKAIPILKPINSIFKGLPYPVPVLFDTTVIHRRNILILISSIHGNRWANYWDNIKDVLKQFNQKNYKIFIKDHPGIKSMAKKHLSSYDFEIIDNKINAEIVYFSGKYDIGTVIGYGSTAMLTASWLGLRVIDFTALLGYSEATINYYNDFLLMGKNINIIKNIDDLKLIIEQEYYPKPINKEVIIKEWKNVLAQII